MSKQGQDRPRRSVTRRIALKSAAASALVLAAPAIWRQAGAAGKRIVIRDSGGPFSEAYREAFYKPFQQATGIEAVGVTSAHDPVAEVKSMVDTKTFTWNIASLGAPAAVELVRAGNYLEKHGLEKESFVAEIPADYITPYAVGSDVYSTVLAYRSDKFQGKKAPASWKDLFDLSGVPGRRGLRKYPVDMVELALLASGVTPDKLYPCDVDRAFKQLDILKPHAAAWWSSGAQATQMLVSGEVDMVPTWVSRAQAAVDAGAPVGVMWDQNIWNTNQWTILKGAPEQEACREFIKFCSDGARQAVITKYVVAGPTNPSAYKTIDEKKAVNLPTFEANRSRGIHENDNYWAENRDKVLERFNAWILA
jgi:putative spermidine/putrescine transport system substrate-binding protein